MSQNFPDETTRETAHVYLIAKQGKEVLVSCAFIVVLRSEVLFLGRRDKENTHWMPKSEGRGGRDFTKLVFFLGMCQYWKAITIIIFVLFRSVVIYLRTVSFAAYVLVCPSFFRPVLCAQPYLVMQSTTYAVIRTIKNCLTGQE